MSQNHNSFLKNAYLSILVFLHLYVCGRLGLIIHEIVGHGLPSLLLSEGRIHLHLSYFSGGWVRYSLSSSPIHNNIITMGGILIELCLGIITLLIHRKWKCPALFILCAMVFIIHGLFYLSDGSYFGYGDGRLIHQAFPESLMLISILLLIVISLTCFFLFRAYSDQLLPGITAQSFHQLSLKCFVIIFAAIGIHAILTISENALSKDLNSKRIYQQEADRIFEETFQKHYQQKPSEFKEAELKKLIKQQPELEASYEAVQDKRQDPFRLILLACMVLATLLGLRFRKKHSENTIKPTSMSALLWISLGIMTLTSLVRYCF